VKQILNYRHKKVLVLGLAKSGVSAASLLHKLGAFVTVNDQKPLSENPEAQGLLEQGIKVICGDHPIELLDEGFELIVKNPGIPYHNPMISGAIDRDIPIITEVELAYEISEAPFWDHRDKWQNDNDNTDFRNAPTGREKPVNRWEYRNGRFNGC
jgi:UDP-N-acetylmuramoylalanine--D-glutamate ligase